MCNLVIIFYFSWPLQELSLFLNVYQAFCVTVPLRLERKCTVCRTSITQTIVLDTVYLLSKHHSLCLFLQVSFSVQAGEKFCVKRCLHGTLNVSV